MWQKLETEGMKKDWFCENWPTAVDALDYLVNVLPMRPLVKLAVGLVKVLGNSLHKRYCGGKA